jgi:uncharacterized repeat protein (TIGR01451 family)
MNFKTFIPVVIAASCLIPASASAATCADPSINVSTEQAIVTVGQPVNYSYSFCYQSQSDHYTAQVIQTQNAEGAAMNTAVSPAQVVAMDGVAGDTSGSGSFTPANAGRYKVVVAYYEKGQSAWESQGEALIIAHAAPAAPAPPVAAPEVTPPAPVVVTPPAAVPAPPVVTPNPPAVPIGTAVPTKAVIALTKRALHATVKAGSVASFLLKVTNTSKVTATDVVVCDSLPTQTQYVGASKSATFHGSSACFTVGNMKAGSSASITIRLSINTGTHGSVTNHATATASNANTVHAQAKVTVPAAPTRKVVAPVTG